MDLAKFQQNKKSSELVAWVKSTYEEMKSARMKIILNWNLNLAFYYGNQYLELAPAYIGGRLILPKAPPYRVRQVSNRIRPVVRTELARVTSQKPNASVVPASSEDEDLAAAYAGEQVWESISSTNHLDTEFQNAALWMLLTGTGFIKTWWDPNAVYEKSPTSEIMGDIKYASVTPYHLFVPDLRTVGIQDQPYVLNLYTKTVAQVQRIYGNKLQGIDIKPDVVASQEILQDSVLNLAGSTKTEPDSVLCMELWAKPGAHRLVPKGGLIHIVGDTVVHFDEQIPYSHGKYPFTKLDHIPSAKFYAESTITDLIGLQREYNRTRSQIIEAKNRMAKPQLLYVKGSLDISKVTTEPGQGIPYRPGFNPPTPLPLVNLPPYVLQELDRILMDIEDISGQHQVSRGGVPPGVTAATAISYLQEKDDSLLSHTYSSVERGFEDIAQQTLYLVTQYWDIERTVKVVGTDGYFDVLQLKGSDVCTDIRMEGGSALPTSKSARQAFLMDLMKMGFINPQDGLKLLDMGGVQKLYEQLKIDESQAQRENIKLKRVDPQQIIQYQQQYAQEAASGQDINKIDTATGQPLNPPAIIPVNTWDNHAVHIDRHNRFRKSQAYELLDPEIQAEFEKHVNTHTALLMESAMQNIGTDGQGPSSDYTGGNGSSGPLPTTSLDSSGVAPPDMGGING
jgi:hypothetical protein